MGFGMSALRDKADEDQRPSERPLIATSGHSALGSDGGVDAVGSPPLGLNLQSSPLRIRQQPASGASRPSSASTHTSKITGSVIQASSSGRFASPVATANSPALKLSGAYHRLHRPKVRRYACGVSSSPCEVLSATCMSAYTGDRPFGMRREVSAKRILGAYRSRFVRAARTCFSSCCRMTR